MLNYGEALKYQREINGKSLLDIQKATGISNQNLSRWERGDVLPNIDFCVRLASFYGITLDELVGLDQANTSTVNNTIASAALSKDEKETIALLHETQYPDKVITLVKEFIKLSPRRQDTFIDYIQSVTESDVMKKYRSQKNERF